VRLPPDLVEMLPRRNVGKIPIKERSPMFELGPSVAGRGVAAASAVSQFFSV